MRGSDRRARKGNWLEVWSRRSRLRSASRVLVASDAPPPRIAAEASSIVVLDNAGAATPPKRRGDDVLEVRGDGGPDCPLLLEQIKEEGEPYDFGSRGLVVSEPIVIDDDDERPPKRPRDDIDGGEDVHPGDRCLLEHRKGDSDSCALGSRECVESEPIMIDGDGDCPPKRPSCDIDGGKGEDPADHLLNDVVDGSCALQLPASTPPLAKKGDIVEARPIRVVNENTPPKFRASDIDPDYSLFLQNLRVDGKSYVLETKDSGLMLLLKYEEDESEALSKKKKYYKPKKKSEKGSPVTVKRKAVDDEDYLVFLKHVSKRRGSMVLQLDNNPIIRYEEKEGITSELQREELQVESVEKAIETHIKTENFEEDSYISNGKMVLQPYNSSHNSNILASEDDGCCIVTVNNVTPSLFVDKLKDVLNKPFDQKEYDELMTLATKQIPKEKEKHLRSKPVSYALDELAPSYFDHYPKLAKMIECADRYEGLVLLRGLFCYLKNVVHDGVFLPWDYASSNYENLPQDGGKPLPPIEISEI